MTDNGDCRSISESEMGQTPEKERENGRRTANEGRSEHCVRFGIIDLDSMVHGLRPFNTWENIPKV